MAARHADEYSSFGSVPEERAGGGGGSPISAHATADDFGAGIGTGLQKVGAVGEQLGNRLGTMMSETAANNAEVGFIKASGDLTAKYRQYEGSQAEAMRPQYENELSQLHAQYRQNLSLVGQHQFDMTTTNQIAHYTNEYSLYAAGQVKEGNIKSQQAIGGIAVNSAANLGSVLDDRKVGEALGAIAHTGNAIADVKGLGYLASGQDKDTGNYSYPDTPEGQAAKAQHLSYTDGEKAKYFLTAAKTVNDNQGATAAATWAQKHWDMMPDAAKAQMNAFLAPKIRNEKIAGIVNNTITGAEQEYTQKTISGGDVRNPLDIIRQNEGIGYSKDNKGEVVNGINSQAFPKEFSEAKKILDTQGKEAATKYSDSFYQKNILDKYSISSLPAGTQAIVADGLVNHGTGDFGKSLIQAAKDGASPQQLIDMRRNEYQRLAKADPETYGASLEGWNARLDRLQQNTGIPGAPQPSQQSKGDYFKENEEQLVQQAADAHLQQFPGDEYGALSTANRTRTQVNRIISMQNKQLNDAVDTVAKAVQGDFAGGRKPTTLQEIGLFDPKAGDALTQLEQGQPKVVRSIEKQLAANVNGETKKGYGDGFLSTLNRIASDDPTDTIKDSKELTEMYGERSDLYIRGFTQAGKLLQQAQTPEGKAVLSTQAQYLNDLRSRMVAGESDTAGKAAFNKAMPAFFAAYGAAQEKGDVGDVLSLDANNPKSFAATLKLPTSSELVSKKIESTSKWLASTYVWGDMFGGREEDSSVFTPAEKVMSDFHDGKITEAEKNERMKTLGVGQSPKVPRPE